MMRNLGIVILLSAASLAQTPATPSSAQPATKPAAVSVQSAKTQVSKTAPPAKAAKPAAAAKSGVPPTHKPVVTANKGAHNAKTHTSSTAKSGPLSAKPGTIAVKSASAKPATVAVKKASAKPATIAVTKAPAKPMVMPAHAMPQAHPVQAVAVKAASGPAKVAVGREMHSKPVVAVSAHHAPNSAKPAVVAVQPKAGAKIAVQPQVKVETAKAAQSRRVRVKAMAKSEPKVVSPKPVVAAVAAPKAEGSAQESKPAADNSAVATVAKDLHFEGRDPFVSPVVAIGSTGSGCSSGKRCLTIDQVNLKGVVKSEAGMIAVVTNSVDKAYFLRENDPVFDGYVEKITGDSIVFKETFHDKLGKTLTRDVTKTITRPAV